MTTRDTFLTRSSGIEMKLPLFIPVYRPDHSFKLFNEEGVDYGQQAVMVNSFLLYRAPDIKKTFDQGRTLREHIGGFEGMICTDSGAFQQLGGRKVNIDPLNIVKFQNMIKTDIAAPLDLITPPETDFEETKRRMIVSQYRIEEALGISDYSDLAGIQQGGGFFSLRQKHIRQLADTAVRYYGIGSMVPFFNKDHDLTFTCGVISDARSVIGQGAPMHVYGAGDPLDMAFMFAAGANLFDSSSYAHYAQRGYYMTPYGAVNKRAACEQLGYTCSCPVCSGHDIAEMFDKGAGEPLLKQHNLFVILETVRTLRECAKNGLTWTYISSVYEKHTSNPGLFPDSRLARSWERYLKGDIPENAAENNTPLSIPVQNAAGPEGKSDSGKLTAIEESLLESLAAESAETYKMDRAAILKLVSDEYLSPKNQNFRSRVNNINTLNDVLRLGGYKTFRKNARGSIYQGLRRYKPAERSEYELLAGFIECNDDGVDAFAGRLLEEHVSTKERLPNREGFIECLQEHLKPGDTVIDIGCGYAPLMLPAEFFRSKSCYIAVDKDTESTEIIRIFAKKYGVENLKAYTWDIGNGLADLKALTGIDHYDTALMLQVIPVVNRADQARKGANQLLPVLGRFPASNLLATVSRESMTKYESIERRELSVLRQFIHTYDLRIESEFSCGAEVGYFLSGAR